MLQQLEILPRYECTTTQLLEDYSRNELAAELKYKGKIVRISGPILDIGRLDNGRPYISLGSEDSSRSVVCSFSNQDTETLSSLSKREMVVVKGRVDTVIRVDTAIGTLLKECKLKVAAFS